MTGSHQSRIISCPLERSQIIVLLSSSVDALPFLIVPRKTAFKSIIISECCWNVPSIHFISSIPSSDRNGIDFLTRLLLSRLAISFSSLSNVVHCRHLSFVDPISFCFYSHHGDIVKKGCRIGSSRRHRAALVHVTKTITIGGRVVVL